jgi:hypothetical protein
VALFYFSCSLLATFGEKISPRKKILEEIIHEDRTACSGSHDDVGGSSICGGSDSYAYT